MNGMEFFHKVAAHDDLEWLGAQQGMDPSTDEVYVGYSILVGPDNEQHRKHWTTFVLPVSEILDSTWEELEGILTGKREAFVLSHATRVVGYFSQVHNWNMSKQAELKDRQVARELRSVPEDPKALEGIRSGWSAAGAQTVQAARDKCPCLVSTDEN